MLRENLVGVIIEMALEGAGSPRQVVLVEFMGEGAESVVYAYAELDDLSRRDFVIKFRKRTPMMEMETLHYQLRIHAEAYPDHPLLMSPQARLGMLTAEMMRKVDNGHLLFTVGLYVRMLQSTVQVLATGCAEPFARAEPLGPLLDSHPVREWLDDNLVHHLDDLLDEDSIVEDHRPLVEELRDEIEAGIERWRAAGTYLPLSRNPLVNLVGLYAEDFISGDEMHHLSRTAEFAARRRPEHDRGLFDLIAGLYYYLRGRLERGEGGRPELQVPMAACDLLAGLGSRRLLGLAQLWKARCLRLAGGAELPRAEQTVRSALGVLDQPEDRLDRHDALLLLAELKWPADREAAERYLREAQRIRGA